MYDIIVTIMSYVLCGFLFHIGWDLFDDFPKLPQYAKRVFVSLRRRSSQPASQQASSKDRQQ